MHSNDLVTNRRLDPETLQCLANESGFSSLGLYVNARYGSSDDLTYHIYSSETLKRFNELSIQKELIFLVSFSKDKTAKAQVSDALGPFLNSNITKVWIRPQLDPHCPDETTYTDCQSPSKDWNLQYLLEVIKETENKGFEVGLSTKLTIWRRWFPELATLKPNIPLMYDENNITRAINGSSWDYRSFAFYECPTRKFSRQFYANEKCCWLANVAWNLDPNCQKLPTWFFVGALALFLFGLYHS